jgi:hypothetical protein
MIPFLLLLIVGCGGGGGNNGSPSGLVSDSSDTNSDTTNEASDEATDDATGDYDIAEYLFDASLEQVGSSISYVSHMHNSQSGDEIMAEIENSEQWEKTDSNTIVFSVNNTGDPSSTYIIHDTLIEDVKNQQNNAKVSMSRYVVIGEAYIDEDVVLQISDNSHLTCEVLDHLDNLDLSTITQGMAEGLYQDVLHVRCLMTMEGVPFTDVEAFYAKDIGYILGIGNLGLFMGGPYIIIPERSGTIYYGTK